MEVGHLSSAPTAKPSARASEETQHLCVTGQKCSLCSGRQKGEWSLSFFSPPGGRTVEEWIGPAPGEIPERPDDWWLIRDSTHWPVLRGSSSKAITIRQFWQNVLQVQGCWPVCWWTASGVLRGILNAVLSDNTRLELDNDKCIGIRIRILHFHAKLWWIFNGYLILPFWFTQKNLRHTQRNACKVKMTKNNEIKSFFT